MTFPRYPAYKDSGVEWLGEIPAHWQVRRLKHLCSVLPSNVDKKSQEGEPPVLLCNYTDVYYSDRIVEGMAFMPATASPQQVEAFSLRAGDTIITKDSETADDIAISAYVPDDLPGVVCGYHLALVRPFAGAAGAAGAFIKRLFDSAYVRSSVAVRANGLTRVGLGQHEVANLELPFPAFDEQATIAAFLDREVAKIDALVAEQERLIELLKEKRQAVIAHAVTKGLNPDAPMKDSGIAWLGPIPAHWHITALKHMVTRIEQGWSPQCEAYPAPDGSWGVLKVGCCNGDSFDEEEQKALPDGVTPDTRYEVAAGDIIMSRGNTQELVGSAAVVGQARARLLLSDLLYRFRARPTIATAQYLVLYLRSRHARFQLQRAATGTSPSMKKVGQADIKEVLLPCPPRDEQVAIAAHLGRALRSIDTLTTEAERAIELLQERRAALISAAVTGQIDVRPAAERGRA